MATRTAFSLIAQAVHTIYRSSPHLNQPLQANSEQPGSHDLSSLLSMLNDKPGSSSMPLADETTVDLMRRLLSRDDYVCVADQLGKPCDVTGILELLLCMLRNPCLSSLNPTVNMNWRARHLMNKILSKNPVLPPSFKVTEVIVPDRRNCVGHGGYGNVYTGKFRGSAVALKMLHKANDHLAYCREALMWRSLEHDFVLPFIGIHEYEEDATVFLVSPYMKNGTLAQWRKTRNPSRAEIRECILEVAQGMEYIHSEGVVHGDLRGENILLDDHLHIQIADFGLTRLLDATNTQSGAKHLNFAAPELFGCFQDADDDAADNPARTQMSDVYAFGCLFYEIHYDSIPYAGRNELQIMAHVTRGKNPPRQDEPSLSDEAWELIQQCWAMNPSERPKMKGVMKRMKAICRPVLPLLPPVMEQPNKSTAQLSFVSSIASPRSDCVALLSLLDLLNDKQPGYPITSVVNATTINLMYKLLSQKDYASVAKTLTRTSDVAILLDFMLHLLRNCLYQIPNQDQTVNIDHRARRFMIKAISRIPVIPATMIVSDVRMSDPRNCIGSGGFGHVFKGKLRGRVVALKMLNKSDNDVAFCREALMWQFLKHDFVLPFLGIYVDESTSQCFLISPYMPNGTLAQWRKMNPNPSVAEIKKRILEVAQGVEYIHSEGVVHGGLRGANILVDANFRVQIADFALTRLSEATVTGSGALYANFAAPELFTISGDVGKHEPARTKLSDVYAFGCLYYEIYYDRIPFEGITEFQILRSVSQGKRPPRLSQPPLNDGAWNLIQRCWAGEASKRPSMEHITQRMTIAVSKNPILSDAQNFFYSVRSTFNTVESVISRPF